MNNKELIKEFAIANLGKEVRWSNEIGTPFFIGMIVGYCTEEDAVMISFTHDIGWGSQNRESRNMILINSPLNVSFWYIYLEEQDRRWEIIE